MGNEQVERRIPIHLIVINFPFFACKASQHQAARIDNDLSQQFYTGYLDRESQA